MSKIIYAVLWFVTFLSIPFVIMFLYFIITMGIEKLYAFIKEKII